MSHPSRYLIYLLAVIIALGPLSVDLYLPAMPAMRVFFDTDISNVQLTLSSYLLGFSIFHLLCGPLSDRFGRKPVLLGGLALYSVMSVFCAMAQSIEQLIIFRFFQAMGACCAPTLGRAIVRDVYPPNDAVKALAYVSSLMAVAPVIAPTLGGIMIQYFSWASTFWVLVAAGLLAMCVTLFFVPESLPEKQSLQLTNIIKNYTLLIKHPLFLGHVLSSSFIYASAFAFLSGASFILIDFMGVPSSHFGLYFLFVVAGYITGNLFTAKLAFAWPVQRIYWISIGLSLAAAMAMLLASVMHWYQPLWFVAPIFFSTLAIGLILPRAMAESLKPFAHMAATTSALMGFLQMSIASVAGWLVGHFLHDQPLPLALVLLGAAVAAGLCYWCFLRPVIQEHP